MKHGNVSISYGNEGNGNLVFQNIDLVTHLVRIGGLSPLEVLQFCSISKHFLNMRYLNNFWLHFVGGIHCPNSYQVYKNIISGNFFEDKSFPQETFPKHLL
jgi:hypothetical protein